jgi:hypothetical protein
MLLLVTLPFRANKLKNYFTLYLCCDNLYLPGTVVEGCGTFSFCRYKRLSTIFGLYNTIFVICNCHNIILEVTQFSLSSCQANFFGAPKRNLSTSKQNLGSPRLVRFSSQPSSSVSPCNRTSGEQTPRLSPDSHLGEAVKQLAPTNLGLHSSMDRPVNGSGTTSVPLRRNPGSISLRLLKLWGLTEDITGKLAYSALMGFIVYGTLKLLRFQFGHTGSPNPSRGSASILSLNETSAPENSFITSSIRKHFDKLSKMLWLHDRIYSRSKEKDKYSVPSDVAVAVSRQTMDIQEAEALVKQWQDMKSAALGPDYLIDMLPEILDGSMLTKVCLQSLPSLYLNVLFIIPLFMLWLIKGHLVEQWQDLASLAKDQSCYWRFVLLNLSIARAEVILDEVGGGEAAEIDVVLEEAAELVDDSQPKKPSYYRYFST